MRRRIAMLAISAALCCLSPGTYGAWWVSGQTTQGEGVTAVFRKDLGQLKWVATQPTPLTPLEERGHLIYLRGGCFYCHSQYVRPVSVDTRPWGPVTADTRRWGPVAEPGEYAQDVPHLFGPGGVGPDLSREGLKYGDEWHLAHFWNPPMMTRGSMMGGFSGLFDAPAARVKIVDGPNGSTLDQTAATKGLFDYASKDMVKLTPNADGFLFVPMAARGKYPLVWLPNKEYGGADVKLVAETENIQALIAYIQKLGMNRGQWRDLEVPEETEGAKIVLPRSDEGDGNGWATTFLYKPGDPQTAGHAKTGISSRPRCQSIAG